MNSIYLPHLGLVTYIFLIGLSPKVLWKLRLNVRKYYILTSKLRIYIQLNPRARLWAEFVLSFVIHINGLILMFS